MSNLIELREKRGKAVSKAEGLVEAAKAEARSLTDDEGSKFTKYIERVKQLDAEIATAEAADELHRAQAAAVANVAPAVVADNVGGAVVRRERLTYDEFQPNLRNGGNSWALDMALVAAGQKDAGYTGRAAEARQRLAQHAKEVDIEMRGKSAAERRDFDRFMEERGGSVEQRVNPNTTFGTGGEFVPPLWAISQYAPYKRPTRVAANRCVNMALPPGIDIINVPKITTGSLTQVQAAQGGAVASQDIVTTTVSAAVRTLSGQEDISLQLLEQSPLAMDGVIFQDLSRDYDRTLDQQVIYGSGINGQHLGVLSLPAQTVALNTLNSGFASQIPATSAVFADNSTTATQYRAIVNGVNQIETLYFDAPTGIWVHPRRANSWAAAADTTGRPLFTQAKYGQYNQYGTNESSPQAQGIAGELYGLPVIKDANMPTTVNGFSGTQTVLTAGTQDAVIVVDESQLWLWEGPLRLRALPEILSGSLQIRFQAYAYSAFMCNRFPTAVSILAGAGVAAPAF